MSDDVLGHEENPATLLENVFTEIAADQMYSLPFYQGHIPVRACGMALFEGQWFGAMLTPWMLSLVILPGPGQLWVRRVVGERQALALPCGNVSFTVSETEAGGQYLSRSLMSPLEEGMSAEQAVLLATQSAKMALSLPLVDADHPVNRSRRALFSPKRSMS